MSRGHCPAWQGLHHGSLVGTAPCRSRPMEVLSPPRSGFGDGQHKQQISLGHGSWDGAGESWVTAGPKALKVLRPEVKCHHPRGCRMGGSLLGPCLQPLVLRAMCLGMDMRPWGQ